jgi:hypothetical protein
MSELNDTQHPAYGKCLKQELTRVALVFRFFRILGTAAIILTWTGPSPTQLFLALTLACALEGLWVMQGVERIQKGKLR